jgi:predicted membrane channel-forming protein YqfA (hemolysin III family)
MTTFLKWGYIGLGILGIIFEISEIGDEAALILALFCVAFIIVEVIWARRLSQKWTNLSSWHKKTADLLRNYVYLGLGCFVIAIIAGAISEAAGDFVTYVISGGVDLYLFYLFGKYYKEMANVCAYVKRNPNNTTE